MFRNSVNSNAHADLSSGSQTPSSVASSKVSAADRDRKRRRPSETRRPWESQSRATPSRLVPPTPLPRKGRIQQADVEEEVIEKALRKRREALARWKTSASSALRQSAELAEKTLVEEATEFFTRKWTKEVPPGSAEQKDKEVEEARRSSAVDGGEVASEGATPDVNEPAHEAEEDEENLLTSDDYVPDEQLACKIVKAEYNPRVDTNLHFPSSSKVPFSAKLGAAGGNEADSGDRTRPGSPIRNNLRRFAINQMEHRLINQGELQWFNSEGTVDTSPITISDKPFRLRSCDEDTRAFKPKYRKAMHCVPYRCDSEPELELELDVSSLRFQHHPLFSAEHVLAAKLTGMYEAYAALALSGDQAPPPCKEKMDSLREDLDKLNEEASEKDFSQIRRTILDVIEQRQKADAQMDSLKTVVEKMKRVWEDMERLRRTQGYTSTTVNLKFRRRCSDREVEYVPPQEAPTEEELFSEEVELRKLLQQLQWMEYEKKLHLWHQQKRLKQREGVDGEELEADKPDPPADVVESEIAELVRQRVEKQREVTESVAYLTRGQTTPVHQCPSEEQQRRQDVAKTSVHIRIMFNEKEVCKTDTRPLGEEFVVVWGQIFALRILQFPRTISLEVRRRTPLFSTAVRTHAQRSTGNNKCICLFFIK